jgi:hypothetical protein
MHKGKQATHQQITVKYHYRHYYLQVQCLLLPNLCCAQCW